MVMKNFKPVTPSTRSLKLASREGLWKGGPLKMLTVSTNSKAGRNNYGQITVRRRGGGHKKASGISFDDDLRDKIVHLRFKSVKKIEE